MTRAEVVDLQASRSEEGRRLGVTSLYLFGSATRDAIGPESDGDMFVDYDLELFRLEALLYDALRRPAEVTTRKGLHPLIRPEVEREAVRVL